jgi:TusA-related sulfurtransferase
MPPEELLVAPEGIAPSALCEGGDLDCGSGLLLVIRRAMERVGSGDVLEIRSTELSVREDLPAWCRLTSNPYLGWRAGERGHRFFVRNGGAEGSDTAGAEATARRYRWRVRARGAAGRATVYARNHRWEVGQPASFDVRDDAPSAIEYVLGALAAALATGLRLRASRENVEIADLEVSLNAGLENVFAFIGDELGRGHSGMSDIAGSVYVRSPADAAVLRRLWSETLDVSPILNSLVHPVKIDVELKSSA